MMTSHGEFNWIELQTYRPNEAIAFYRETIGWQFDAERMPSGGTYFIGLASGKPVCGVLTLDRTKSANKVDRWVTYIHIDDLEEAIVRLKNAGGEVLKAPWVAPGVGRITWIRDPVGAEIGWVTPEQKNIQYQKRR